MGFFFKFLLTTALWGLTGAVGGFVAGFALTQGLFIAWQPVLLPDEAVAVELLAIAGDDASLGGLIAQSSAGLTYYYDVSIDPADEQWLPLSNPETAEPYFFGTCTTAPLHDSFWIRGAPGTVTQQVDCESMWAEIVLYYRFAQLDNGEIHLWRHSGGINNFITLFFAVTLPCITLALIGSFLFGINQYRRISREVPPPEPD